MDFGVFNLLQHRDRSKSPHQVLEEALSHTCLAEELGFSRVWFAEHHFSNYSVSPSPLILCTHVDCARFQNRIAFTLENRHETMVDDYMVDEVPFPDGPPLDDIAKNIVAGNTEVVAERLCEEIELYRPRHMCLYFAVGDLPSVWAMKSMEQFATKVVPMIEAHFGKPLAEICDVPLPVPVAYAPAG